MSEPNFIPSSIENEAESIKQIFAHNVGNVTFQSEESEPTFSTLKQDSVDIQAYVAPTCLPETVQRLKSESLIILGGNVPFDKLLFAKKVGAELSRQLNRPLVLRERLFASKAYSIFPLIDREENKNGDKEGKILIFDASTPHEFHFNLDKLYEILRRTGNFAILCSHIPESTWKLTETNLRLWYELPEVPDYEPAALKQYLLHKLKHSYQEGNIWMRNQTWTEDSRFGEKISLTHVAEELNDPGKIDLLLRHIAFDFKQEKPTDQALETLIQKVRKGNHRNQLHTWYHALSFNQQLIATALHLFEGVYMDQFFAIVRELLANKWKTYASTIRVLDYQHMEFAHDFFQFEGQVERPTLRSRYPNQRLEFLKIAWSQHRQHTLLVIEFMLQLVASSVENRLDNWELFGSPTRRKLLRHAISEALSDVGLISNKTIDLYLLTLAANNHAGVYTVTAKAIARWHYDQDDRFFQFLDNWESNPDVRETIKFIQEKQQTLEEEKSGKSTPLTHIQATIAITLGYASLGDQPNHVPPKILTLLARLISDKKEEVRNGIRNFTLPLIIQNHLGQLSEIRFLEKCIVDKSLVPAVAEGLARAYLNEPHLVKEIMDTWRSECVKAVSGSGSRRSFTNRELKVFALIQTYRVLPYHQYRNNVIKQEEAFQVYGELRKYERHSELRSLLLDATIDLIEQSYPEVPLGPNDLLANIDKTERDYIVQEIGYRFKQQRKQQEGGDYEISHNGDRLHIWIDNDRPKLPLEEIVKSWRLSDHTGIVQIATLIEAHHFTSVKRWEQEHLEQIIIERARIRNSSKKVLALPGPRGIPQVQASMSTKIYVGLAGFKEGLNQKERQFLNRVVPVAIQRSNISEGDVRSMVAGWRKDYKENQSGLRFQKIEKAVSFIYFLRKFTGRRRAA